MKATSTKGFTLIELAVVIAIIAILAAIAIPRFGDATIAAERSMLQDFAAQLNSASAIYTAENAVTPDNFTDFVSAAQLTDASTETLSTLNFGDGNCTPSDDSFACSGSGGKCTGTYTWNGGNIAVVVACN